MKIEGIEIPIGKLALTLLVVFFLANIAYLIKFASSNFSNCSIDWGAYGSFISGITSILNLVVFIFLTVYVAKLGAKNSTAQIATQEKITELQVAAQKKIMLAQLRQIELNKLNEELDKPFTLIYVDDKDEKWYRYKQLADASVYLRSFLNQKQYLFPILATSLIRDNTTEIHKLFDEFICHMNVKDVKIKLDEATLMSKVQDIFFLKSKLIKDLQIFILDDL